MPDAQSHPNICVHGLVGVCPDCPPRSFDASSGKPVGLRFARVKGRTVERVREDGFLDWYTVHLTKWGARRSARLYERTGLVRGMRP